MSQRLGAYGRGRGGDMWQWLVLWQGVGACGRGWWHVAGCGNM